MSIRVFKSNLEEEQLRNIRKYLSKIKKKNILGEKEAEIINNYKIEKIEYFCEEKDDFVDDRLYHLPFTFARKILKTNNDYINYSESKIKYKKTPYDRQIPLIKKAKIQLKKYRVTTLNVRPGCGKTFMSIYLAKKYGLLTCILLKNSLLIEQWYNEIKDNSDSNTGVWVILNKKNDDIDKYPPPENIDIIICLWKRSNRIDENIRDKVGMLIVDECDEFCCREGLRSMLDFEPKYIISCTATYERKDGMHQIMDAFMGLKRVQGGELLNFDVYRTNTGIQGNRVENRMRNRRGCDWNILQKSLLYSDLRNEKITNLCMELLDQDRKIIIITSQVKHAGDLSNLLIEKFKEKKLDYTSDYLTGKKPKYSDCNVLVGNYHKCGRGFDEKAMCKDFNGIRINTVIIVCSFKDERLLYQCVGRGFRARCPIVYHFVDDDKTIRDSHWTRSNRLWYKRNGGNIMEIDI